MKYKIFVTVIVLIILYLFALNGRYCHVESLAMFDKWKQEWIVPTDDSMIEIEK